MDESYLSNADYCGRSGRIRKPTVRALVGSELQKFYSSVDCNLEVSSNDRYSWHACSYAQSYSY